MKKEGLILLILFFVFIICLSIAVAVITKFVIVHQLNECTSNPLIYSAKFYKEISNADDVFGTLILMKKGKRGLEIDFDDKSKKEIKK